MTLPGLSKDTVVVERPLTTVNSEGSLVGGTPTSVYVGRGTWGSPSTTDFQVATQDGQQLDAVVTIPSLSANIQPGDRMTVRSVKYDVTQVRDVRTHLRVFGRKVS